MYMHRRVCLGWDQPRRYDSSKKIIIEPLKRRQKNQHKNWLNPNQQPHVYFKLQRREDNDFIQSTDQDHLVIWSFFLHFIQVREIEREAHYETEVVQEKDSKQNAAIDLSKRLKDFRSLNDASSLKGTVFSALHYFSFIKYKPKI